MGRKVIVITSGKRRCWKNDDNSKYRDWVIAAAEKVVVIDTDLGLRNLDVVMGLENRIVYILWM